jgi:hypothetical protein
MMVVFLHPGLNTAFALCFAFMLYALLLFAFCLVAFRFLLYAFSFLTVCYYRCSKCRCIDLAHNAVSIHCVQTSVLYGNGLDAGC